MQWKEWHYLLQHDEVKCSWQNIINQGKVRLCFQVHHYQGLQLMYSNLQWTERLSQKTLISTRMQYRVNIILLPSKQIQLWDCIFIPTEAAKLCIWQTELEIHYLGCFFFVVEALKAYTHKETVWGFIFTSTVAIFNHMWMQIKSPGSCVLFLMAV